MRFLFIMATIAIVTLVGCTTPPAERPRASPPDSAPLLSIRRARAEPDRDRADSGQTRGRHND